MPAAADEAEEDTEEEGEEGEEEEADDEDSEEAEEDDEAWEEAVDDPAVAEDRMDWRTEVTCPMDPVAGMEEESWRRTGAWYAPCVSDRKESTKRIS